MLFEIILLLKSGYRCGHLIYKCSKWCPLWSSNQQVSAPAERLPDVRLRGIGVLLQFNAGWFFASTALQSKIDPGDQINECRGR